MNGFAGVTINAETADRIDDLNTMAYTASAEADWPKSQFRIQSAARALFAAGPVSGRCLTFSDCRCEHTH
jgi:hypothetical protein